MAIIISTENYTIVQIKKNIDDYLAGNLEDNPPPPNWDGTIEKAPVAKTREQIQIPYKLKRTLENK